MYHVISPTTAVLILLALGAGWFLLEKKLGRWLAARVRVVVIPTGGGDGTEVRGRIDGLKLKYSWGGVERVTEAASEAIIGVRRKLRRIAVVHVDAKTGTPFVFEPDSSTPRPLRADKIAAASTHLLKSSFKAGRSGPLAELAPYVPLMVLALLVMVGAIFYASGRSQGWF